MSFSGLVVQLLNGLASASSLFLVAAGLSLIFGVMRIVNFAHGSFFMLGIYLAYTLVERLAPTLGFWPALLLAPVVTGLLLIPAHPLSVTYFRRDTAACCHSHDIVSIRIRFCPAHPVVVMQHANWQREVPGACQCGDGKKGGEAVRPSRACNRDAISAHQRPRVCYCREDAMFVRMEAGWGHFPEMYSPSGVVTSVHPLPVSALVNASSAVAWIGLTRMRVVSGIS